MPSALAPAMTIRVLPRQATTSPLSSVSMNRSRPGPSGSHGAGDGSAGIHKTRSGRQAWQGIGVVQQAAAGDAFISISVQDYAGNRGSPLTQTTDQTSLVLDTQPPTLSQFSLFSNNSLSNYWPNRVTISPSALKQVKDLAPQVTLAGNVKKAKQQYL